MSDSLTYCSPCRTLQKPRHLLYEREARLTTIDVLQPCNTHETSIPEGVWSLELCPGEHPEVAEAAEMTARQGGGIYSIQGRRYWAHKTLKRVNHGPYRVTKLWHNGAVVTVLTVDKGRVALGRLRRCPHGLVQDAGLLRVPRGEKTSIQPNASRETTTAKPTKDYFRRSDCYSHQSVDPRALATHETCYFLCSWECLGECLNNIN